MRPKFWSKQCIYRRGGGTPQTKYCRIIFRPLDLGNLYTAIMQLHLDCAEKYHNPILKAASHLNSKTTEVGSKPSGLNWVSLIPGTQVEYAFSVKKYEKLDIANAMEIQCDLSHRTLNL